MHCEKEDLPSLPMWKENLSGQCLFGFMKEVDGLFSEKMAGAQGKDGIEVPLLLYQGCNYLDILTI